MAEPTLFDPAAFRAWSLVRDRAAQLRRVEVARAGAGVDEPGYEVHAVCTAVAALAGMVRVELGARRRVDLQPGTLLLIAPGVRHRHAPLRRGAASYGQGSLHDGSDVRIEAEDRTWWVLIPLEPSRGLAERALAAKDGEQRRRLGAELMAQLAQSTARPLRAMPEAARRMLDHLRANRYRRINAEDVARASGLGRSRAFALYHQATGETPKAALMRDRLELARHLLREGASAAEAARRCGFRDGDELGRAFKRAHGLSPRAWLKREKNA